jgi:hypothetical protein
MPHSHPWRALRALPEITLQWHDGGDAGWYDFETQTISLRRGMTQAERRSTLRHELEHHFRGPFLEMFIAREEEACEYAAARDLIDIRKLGEALAWTQDLDEVAEELWVDAELVLIRTRRLHAAERAYLRKRLNHLEGDES